MFLYINLHEDRGADPNVNSTANIAILNGSLRLTQDNVGHKYTSVDSVIQMLNNNNACVYRLRVLWLVKNVLYFTLYLKMDRLAMSNFRILVILKNDSANICPFLLVLTSYLVFTLSKSTS